MSYARITIDGKTVMDGDLGLWQNKPPDTFAEYLTPVAKSQPGMKALLIALAEAATMSKNVEITLWNRPNGYELKVIHA